MMYSTSQMYCLQCYCGPQITFGTPCMLHRSTLLHIYFKQNSWCTEQRSHFGSSRIYKYGLEKHLLFQFTGTQSSSLFVAGHVFSSALIEWETKSLPLYLMFVFISFLRIMFDPLTNDQTVVIPLWLRVFWNVTRLRYRLVNKNSPI